MGSEFKNDNAKREEIRKILKKKEGSLKKKIRPSKGNSVGVSVATCNENNLAPGSDTNNNNDNEMEKNPEDKKTYSENPMKNFDSPMKSSDNPMKYSDNPTIYSDNPLKYPKEFDHEIDRLTKLNLINFEKFSP